MEGVHVGILSFVGALVQRVLKVMLFIAKKFGKMNIHDLVWMERSKLDSLDSYV